MWAHIIDLERICNVEQAEDIECWDTFFIYERVNAAGRKGYGTGAMVSGNRMNLKSRFVVTEVFVMQVDFSYEGEDKETLLASVMAGEGVSAKKFFVQN